MSTRFMAFGSAVHSRCGSQFNFTGPMSASEGNIFRLHQIMPMRGNARGGNMIDALFNIAVFAVLVLCIVGFSMYGNARTERRR